MLFAELGGLFLPVLRSKGHDLQRVIMLQAFITRKAKSFIQVNRLA
jgi:hypothetical protein